MSSFSAADNHAMQQALTLAMAAMQRARPNPTVACLVMQKGVVVGRGVSEAAGGRHAEIVALDEAGERARGSEVFVTLEPCAHFGRTPPCIERLIKAGVARVVFAVDDPDPRVNGAGAAALKQAGIAVQSGLLAERATKLHRGFLSRHQRGRPWLLAKLAISLDGAAAMQSGESQWITGPEARAAGHQLRARSSVVLTGAGTVLADDPQMTARLPEKDLLQPIPVVVDSALRSPPDARIWQHSQVRVYTAGDGRNSQLPKHVQCISKPSAEGRVELTEVLIDLASQGHNDVLLEAGPGLMGAFVEAGLVDEFRLFVAPRMLGSETRSALLTPGWQKLVDGLSLNIDAIDKVGDDIMISAFPKARD